MNRIQESESLPPKSLRVTALVVGVILAPCMSYAILGDAPLIPIIAGVFMMISLCIRTPIEITKRSIIYSLTIASLVGVLLNEFYPVDGDRFFIPMPTEVLVPFVVTLAICLSFLAQTPTVLAIIATLAAFAMMFHGSCVSDPANTRLLIDSDLWSNRYWVFGFFLGLQMVAFIPLLTFAQERRTRLIPAPGTGYKRFGLYFISVVSLVSLIVIMCNVAVKVETMMEPVFNSIFRMYAGTFRSKIVFGNEVDLYRKTDPFVTKYEKQITLHAKSKTPPGYLRGRIYTEYRDGRWRNPSKDEITNLAVVADPRDLSTNRFERSPDSADSTRDDLFSVDLFPAKFFYSDVLLASGSTDVIELIADAIASDSDGVLFPREWDRKGGYTISNRSNQQSTAFARPEISPSDIDSYLDTGDAAFTRSLIDVRNLILSNKSGNDPEPIRYIASYLQNNFSYKLGVQLENHGDPVLDFLTETKSGHCELFASAAALLLRTQGIPTRYVTGFVCMEPHPSEGYWIARLGDCHAWVEAWSARDRQWVLVEPTPASGVPSGAKQTNIFTQFQEYLSTLWKDVYSQVKRGYFAEAVLAFLAGVVAFTRWLFWAGPWYVGWGFLMTVGYLVYRFRIGSRRSRIGYKKGYRRDLHSAFRRIEKYLKRFEIGRRPTASIRDLITELDQKQIPGHQGVAALLSEYEYLRYSPKPPSADSIKRFSNRVAQEL